jgi:hypothetical protein
MIGSENRRTRNKKPRSNPLKIKGQNQEQRIWMFRLEKCFWFGSFPQPRASGRKRRGLKIGEYQQKIKKKVENQVKSSIIERSL